VPSVASSRWKHLDREHISAAPIAHLGEDEVHEQISRFRGHRERGSKGEKKLATEGKTVQRQGVGALHCICICIRVTDQENRHG
jgi:hypothetical protein